ncbi:GA-like domain-containing protein [Staphylococcus shinii]|uniref:GA-like domain-containing protein n=1 Tax=Staphylococcus shinii TaxID=2912228 RepID=UPI003F82C81B
MKKANSLFNEKQRYSIRKYHIGAASIIIGSVIFMNTGSISYAAEVDNNTSELIENKIHSNKEKLDNNNAVVQEKESNVVNDLDYNQSSNSKDTKEINKEVPLSSETSTIAHGYKENNLKSTISVNKDNGRNQQLNNQMTKEESQNQIEHNSKKNQTTQSNKDNNHINELVVKENTNQQGTEVINKEDTKQDNLKVDSISDENKMITNQNENRQKVRRKRNAVNPTNNPNIANDTYNRTANNVNTDVSTDGTMTYKWYPVIGGLSKQERTWMTNGVYGDNESRARKKATMLWLIANFNFTEEQRQNFSIQDLDSPIFGDDVYKWLEEAKKGNITPKPGTMNLGRRREMIISGNNIILSDHKAFDRGIINFGDNKNFVFSNDDSTSMVTNSNIDYGFKIKPPFEKVGVNNTWAISENEKEEIRRAIKKANSDINFVRINVAYNGNVFAQALNSSGKIVGSADLDGNEVVIDKIFIEKKEKLDQLISLVETSKLLDENLYIPSSFNHLKNELNYASIVIKDSYDPEMNNIPDIISATDRLDHGINSLVRRANMTELQNAINNAKAQGPFDNSKEEDQAIISALEVGENTVGNANTPQDVVDSATANINNALSRKSQVKNLLQDVENLVSEAEEKNRNASNMLLTALLDGIFINDEKNALIELVNSANDKKAEAQDKVNLLPDDKKTPFQNRLDKLPIISIPEVNDTDGNGIADDVDQAKAQAESKVAEAQGLVDALPDALKGDLPARVDNLTGIQIPEVNDADGNGIADDVDQAKSQAESKVAEAEAADQAAKTKLAEYQQDGLITSTEKTDFENLLATAQSKKAEAQGLVNKLPDALKGDLPTRLNNLTGIQVPEVNDADGNGIADDVDQAKSQAESKVAEAEAADQAAKTKLAEYQQDGLITPTEKTDLENLQSTAQNTKAEAQDLVNKLPDALKGDLPTRLNNLTGIQIPEVNDADGNGIADDVDQAKAQAESKVAEAEAADQAAKTKLAEYQQEGLITSTEKTDLENLQSTAQNTKAEAQDLVNKLPDALKGDLPTRLNNLTGIQIPEVNDADGNGIADEVDQAKPQAESKVAEAEAADQAAKTKLAEYQQDGVITASEKTDLENLSTTAQNKKVEAQDLVNKLPDALKGDLLTRLNNLTGIQVPAVNDTDGNGIADDVDQAKSQAESKVAEAEAADQAAKTKLAEYQQDDLITPTEVAELENLQATAQSKKAEVQGLVDALPDALKDDLPERLDNLTGIQIPEVNDYDGNGFKDDIDDRKDLAESKVIDAEQASAIVKDKLAEYQEDSLITPTELVELENLRATAQSKKAKAQELVDTLPDMLKADLPERLSQLKDIQLPNINDYNGNGINDETDRLILNAEKSVINAEETDKAVKAKLGEYQKDGLISTNEKRELINLLTKAQKSKTEAQGLVDALPNEFKGNLPLRLNNLTGIEIPKVNDADNDGKKDDINQLKALIEIKVQEAEVAHQNATSKLTEYTRDGLINQWEKNDMINLTHEVFSRKVRAFALVEGLPKEQQGEFLNRLNKLENISIPEINDKNNNGIADDVDQAIALAEIKIQEAEAAHQIAKNKLLEYQQDDLISPTEKAELDKLVTEAQNIKAKAQELVVKLPDAMKGDLQNRLNNLLDIQVPEINDFNDNGIMDNSEPEKVQAESRVAQAEYLDQAVKDKLSEYQQNGLITPTEKAELDNLAKIAQNTKAEAQDFVDALPDVWKGDLPTRLNKLTGIQVPAVNDADGNGIADEVDQAKSQAESKVAEAEATDQAAKTKLTEYQQDGLITSTEKTDLENLQSTAQSKKAEAQDLVNKLPDAVKGDLPARLNNLTGIQVPEVNDADGNGIADEVDQAKSQAESKVAEAEAADQAAKTKLAEYQQDGVITPTEVAELNKLSTTAQNTKATAQDLVNKLPDALKGDLPERLDNLTGIQIPEVNDADGNGIADEVDQAKSQAESKVAEAEAADQAAKTKLAEYQQDGVITASEKTDLENLSTTAQNKKVEAQDLVNKLPDAVKGDLPTRLNNLTGIQVPAVNDTDGNGIADEVDQAKAQAESKVTEAEVAYQVAKTKLSEYQQDGLITAVEKANLENLISTAKSKKVEAQKLVNALSDNVKEVLQSRLNKLEDIIIPSISMNNQNSQSSSSHNTQGKDDETKVKDILQKLSDLNNDSQKSLNSKDDTSNESKHTHITTANSHTINTNSVSVNSNNTKRVKDNNAKVLSPSKVYDTKKTKEVDSKVLPNTGEETTQNTTLFGTLLASLGSLMIWRSRKKENTNETK